MTGAPLRSNWVSAQPAMVSACACAIAPALVTGPIAPPRMNGTMTAAWFDACIGAQGRGHGRVPDQRRVDIDIAEDDAVLIGELFAEDDARHFDRLFRPAFRRHRAHEGAVGIFDMGIDHVEMALVDRHIHRLADRAAGMVQRRARPAPA